MAESVSVLRYNADLMVFGPFNLLIDGLRTLRSLNLIGGLIRSSIEDWPISLFLLGEFWSERERERERPRVCVCVWSLLLCGNRQGWSCSNY